MNSDKRARFAAHLRDALGKASVEFGEKHGEPEDQFGIILIVATPDGRSVIRSPNFDRESAAHVLEHLLEDMSSNDFDDKEPS